MTTITNKSPIAINGIFYIIDDKGFLTANVSDQDGIDNMQIRFIGEDARTTELTDEDMKVAEAYRAEIQDMLNEE